MRPSNGMKTFEARPIGNGRGGVNKPQRSRCGIFRIFEGAGEGCEVMGRKDADTCGLKPCGDDALACVGLSIEFAGMDAGRAAGGAAIGQKREAASVLLRDLKGKVGAFCEIACHIKPVIVIDRPATAQNGIGGGARRDLGRGARGGQACGHLGAQADQSALCAPRGQKRIVQRLGPAVIADPCAQQTGAYQYLFHAFHPGPETPRMRLLRVFAAKVTKTCLRVTAHHWRVRRDIALARNGASRVQLYGQGMIEMSDSVSQPPNSSMGRYLPLAAVLIGAGLGYYFFRDYLSFQALADNREALIAFRDANYLLTAGLFVVAYALIVAFSLPGATIATLTGGFLFATFPGALYNITGATIGATAIFLAAQTSFGSRIGARLEGSEGMTKRFKDAIDENQWSALFLLRLVPAVPFFVANVLPALFEVPLRRYMITTFLGIMPGAVVYTSVGAGLGEVFARGETPNLGIIFEPQVLLPILGLCALAALPVALKALRGKKES